MFLACSRNGLACNPSLHRTYTCAEIGHAARAAERACAADRARLGRGSRAVPTSMPMLADASPRSRRSTRRRTLPAPGRERQPPPCDRSRQGRLSRLHLRARPARPSASCIRTTRCWPMPATWCGTGSTAPTPCCSVCRRCLITSPRWRGAVAASRAASSSPTIRRPAVSVLDWIIETGATYVMGVPTHAMDVLAQQKARGLEQLGAVQRVLHGRRADPAVGGSRRSRAGHQAAEHLRHDRELLAPVHAPRRRRPSIIVATCGRGGPATRCACSIRRIATERWRPARWARSADAAAR